MKFQNCSADERLQQVEQAELELVEADGDTLCRLLNRCAAWLRPATFCREGQAETWILIAILRRLDLDDPVTFQRVEVAMLYLQTCLPNLKDLGDQRIRSSQQWQTLTNLAESTASQQGSMRKSSRGHCFKGHYAPSANVRSVSSVFRVDLPVILHCSECSLTLLSCWRFKHPRTKVESVLVPRQGHHACEKRLKRRCKWMAPDGCKLKVDHHPHLVFCMHQRLKIQCIPCGGQRVCPHGRQKTECKECKGSRICPHNRFKDRCKECRGFPYGDGMANEAEASFSGSTGVQTLAAPTNPTLAQCWAPPKVWRLAALLASAERMALSGQILFQPAAGSMLGGDMPWLNVWRLSGTAPIAGGGDTSV
eukprot:s749_g9.t1